MQADALLIELEKLAVSFFDGHFTIMRFTTNWRVGFGTPDDRFDISAMEKGRTFEEAASKAIDRIKAVKLEDGENVDYFMRNGCSFPEAVKLAHGQLRSRVHGMEYGKRIEVEHEFEKLVGVEPGTVADS